MTTSEHPFAVCRVGDRWLVIRLVAFSGDVPVFAETACEASVLDDALYDCRAFARQGVQ